MGNITTLGSTAWNPTRVPTHYSSHHLYPATFSEGMDMVGVPQHIRGEILTTLADHSVPRPGIIYVPRQTRPYLAFKHDGPTSDGIIFARVRISQVDVPNPKGKRPRLLTINLSNHVERVGRTAAATPGRAPKVCAVCWIRHDPSVACRDA